MNANKSGNNAIPRGEKGYFIKGMAPKSPGRPPGSISIMTRIKQKFEEDPELFEEYVDGILSDKMMRKEVVQQVDGKPRESIEITGKDGGALQFQVISFDDYDSIQPEAKQTD